MFDISDGHVYAMSLPDLPAPDPLTALYLEYQTYVTAPTLSAQKIGMPMLIAATIKGRVMAGTYLIYCVFYVLFHRTNGLS
jgi:hypothetical protein